MYDWEDKMRYYSNSMNNPNNRNRLNRRNRTTRNKMNQYNIWDENEDLYSDNIDESMGYSCKEY